MPLFFFLPFPVVKRRLKFSQWFRFGPSVGGFGPIVELFSYDYEIWRIL